MKKVILLSYMFLNACAGTIFVPYDNQGRISLNADEKGLQAFSDMMIGLTNEAKTPQGQKSSHYQFREQQVSWKETLKAKFNNGGENE